MASPQKRRLFGNPKSAKKARPRFERRVALEQLETRRLLAADTILPDLGEGEGAGCLPGFHYPKSTLYTGWIPADISRSCFTEVPTRRGAGESTAAAIVQVVNEVEPNDGLNTATPVSILGTGAGKESAVDINGRLVNSSDADYFRIELKAGDILGVNLFGAALSVSLLDANNRELITSSSDAMSISSPLASPLPSGGNASLARTISRDGVYYLAVSNLDVQDPTTFYSLQTRVHRPVLESTPVGTHQILFVDFNGASVDTAIFESQGVASLSPLRTFLPFWGLSVADEDTVINSILAVLEENISADIRRSGLNGDFQNGQNPGDFDIEILNSRDHGDPFGQPNVSRLIIGGTQGELGIQTVGLAESVDIGNFDTTETAVVLLDLLSGQVTPTAPENLNLVQRAANSTIIDLIGIAVGNIAAHEAGHYFGLFHTNNANVQADIVDSGGNPANTFGLGADLIFGSTDDVDVDFGEDTYSPLEPFTGFQDNLNALSHNLATGTIIATINGTKWHDLDADGVHDADEPGLAGWTIFSDLNGNGLVDLREPADITGTDGSYSLFVAPGTHLVTEILLPGWEQTFPSTGIHTVRVESQQNINNIDFGNRSIFGGISGTKWNDLDGDGAFDANEPGVPGVTIYLDFDGDNRLDLGEPTAITDSKGVYAIPVNRSGTFTVRESVQPGWEITFPRNTEGEHTVIVTSGQSVPNINFGNRASNDFGDAPAPYPTLKADDGAYHAVLQGFRLGGAVVDGEGDGVPTIGAQGDDLNTTIDDEDGVIFTTGLVPGGVASIVVTGGTGGYSPGRLNAWIDFNADGDWNDAGEQIIRDHRSPVGFDSTTNTFTYNFNVNVPASAVPGLTYARFRYGYATSAKPTGKDMAGEVEDYQVRILGLQPIANDDRFEVEQNSVANLLDVLSNDIPSANAPITIVAFSAPSRGGTVQISANNTSLRYTPAAGFGEESFSYTIRDAAGVTSSAAVSVFVRPALNAPVAVDDTFNAAPTQVNQELDVLQNDLSGNRPPVTIVSVTPSGGASQVSIDTKGTADPTDDVLRYTPNGFTGTEQFTYIVEDQATNRATATVTVHVRPGAEPDDDVQIRLIASASCSENVPGIVPLTNIPVGETFYLCATVKDLRTDDGDSDPNVDRFGVFAAYLDLLYDFGLVSVLDGIEYGANYRNVVSGDRSIPGLLDEIGATQTNTANPLGDDEFLLFKVPVRANASGTAVFKADPADRRTGNVGTGVAPDHDVLLFNPPEVVTIDRIRFENTSLVITSGGSAPRATDNTFFVSANSSNVVLDVLGNDVELAARPLSVRAGNFSARGSAGGVITLGAEGANLLYSPVVGFSGVETFTYRATNANNIPSNQATVTVQVGTNPKGVALILETLDLNGNPISSVAAGSDFQVRAKVDDIRTGISANVMGVFAAYFDLLYDSSLVQTIASPGSRFGFDIAFGPAYNLNGLSANNSFPNVIEEVGAFQSSTQPLGSGDRPQDKPPTGNANADGTYTLFTMRMRANVAGTAVFQVDPADSSPFHDVLFYDPPEPAVSVSNISLGIRSLTITPAAAGEGEGYQNPRNRYDVNDDNFVSPVDALILINQLNNGGSRLLAYSSAQGEGESPSLRQWLDVNGDNHLSPIDVVQVVNRLNSQAVAAGEGPVTQAALTAAEAANNSVGAAEGEAASRPLLVGAPATLAANAPDRRASAASIAAVEIAAVDAIPVVAKSAADTVAYDDSRHDNSSPDLDQVLDLFALDVAEQWSSR